LETGAALIHPYDDDRIIAGQATAAKELLEDVPDLEAMLTPVSGGGLLSGTCLGAHGIRPEVRVYGCEPELADDAYRSVKTGTLQSLESSDTIADGLRASLAPRTFAILRKQVAGILLVSEKEIVETMQLVAQRMKIVIEPSSAVALAPLLRAGGVPGLNQRTRKGKPSVRIGIIFSGGNV
jgi:threonine dehydratase